MTPIDSPAAPSHARTSQKAAGALAGRELLDLLAPSDTFVDRHVGPSDTEIGEMLALLGYKSLAELTDATVPASIRLKRPLALAAPRAEHELLQELKTIAAQNKVFRSYIGMGYHGTITPGVIQRNILENPGWYTQYTPYQAEIAQGRLEALLNFQTMVSDLTALPLAGASLLDEGTAAGEAMAMAHSITGRAQFFVAQDCHPQTIAVVQTRGKGIGVEVIVGDARAIPVSDQLAGALFQYPTTDGRVEDYRAEIQKLRAAGALVVMAADILALAVLTPPGELGADIAVGSTQRFGVPMGFGGPHAAYIATKSEHARKMPGRIIGVSRDAQGNMALRMAIQTREQHIKRERATSNICTAQALLAIMAGMYAVYHGPEGVRRIAERVHAMTALLAHSMEYLGHEVLTPTCFDTIRVRTTTKHAKGDANSIVAAALQKGVNVRDYKDGTLGVSLDETTTVKDLEDILAAFGCGRGFTIDPNDMPSVKTALPAALTRTSLYLQHPVFNTHHSEHEMLRYIFKLQSRDLSLAHSMIPLGSCTMKLNGTSEMAPVTWPEFANIHPFAPADQTKGYQRLFADLEKWLAEITGFDAVSLQPNAGAQGEYAGLMVIRAFHESRGDHKRTVCLIPDSAHGTNPASAVVAGFHVVPVACDDKGNINLDDLRAKADEHKADLGALMVTYPSTHGVFEETIREICKIVHDRGGQVYMDGANMNAQVGLTSPGEIGADVCHLNLHKTFCIPHGGGGPGMGPICVKSHLAPFLPGHPVVSPFQSPALQGGSPSAPGSRAIGPVSAAPWGSALILIIPWVYIALMGGEGLTKATQVAILAANYMAKRLEKHYPILYTGRNGRVAHEFILDVRPFDASAGVKVDDFAKRLMDYGFHGPTMSWPVPGTLMFEPTESEPKAELDRLCDAMIAIREEVRAIEQKRMDPQNNPLKHAPHTAFVIAADKWDRPYSRDQAAFPAPWTRDHKFWPAVGRVDNPYGDRNLVCTCPPMSEYSS